MMQESVHWPSLEVQITDDHESFKITVQVVAKWSGLPTGEHARYCTWQINKHAPSSGRSPEAQAVQDIITGFWDACFQPDGFLAHHLIVNDTNYNPLSLFSSRELMTELQERALTGEDEWLSQLNSKSTL